MDDAEEQPRAPRAGRRARARAEDQEAEGEVLNEAPSRNDDGGDGEGEEDSTNTPSLGKPPNRRQRPTDDDGVPATRSGAFGVEPDAADGEQKQFVGVSRRKQQQEQAAQQEKEEQQRPGRGRNKYEDESKETIFDIPELEDEGKEDLSNVVAEAPKVRANRVQDITELEEDSQFRLPPPGDESKDIDLTLLTKVLCSQEQVAETDDIWDEEQLMTDVASELNKEKEKAEAATGTEASSPSPRGNGPSV